MMAATASRIFSNVLDCLTARIRAPFLPERSSDRGVPRQADGEAAERQAARDTAATK